MIPMNTMSGLVVEYMDKVSHWGNVQPIESS